MSNINFFGTIPLNVQLSSIFGFGFKFQNPDPDVVGAAAPEHDLQTVPQAQRGLEARLTALPHSGIPRRLATLTILILLATFAPYRCMVWIWIRASKKRDPDPT